jgi:hypothetical protein
LTSIPLYSSCCWEMGNVEFLSTVLHSSHDLIWKFDQDNRSLFHISILYRQESVFDLLCDIALYFLMT